MIEKPSGETASYTNQNGKQIIALLAEGSKGERKGRTPREPSRNIYCYVKGLLCHQRMYKSGISPQADGKWHAAGHESIRLVKITSLNPIK